MTIEGNYNDGGLTSAAPFFNDWDETKKYIQMLFTPGRALQARELTQLQTMLQVQIDRFGSHIFENGSPVGGGGTTVHTNIDFIRVDLDAAYTNVTDLTALIGTTLTEYNTGVSARVVHVDTTTSVADPHPVMFIQYTSASLDGNTTAFTYESQLTTAQIGSSSSSANGSQLQLSPSSFGYTATGSAYLVSIDQGIFFIDGFFVIVDSQSYAPVVVDGSSVRTYSAVPTTRVGLTNTKTVVDIGGDSSLGDPANGSANFAAPGAQRLKFNPVLAEKEYTDGLSTIANTSDEDFVELLRIADGTVRKKVKYPIYSELEETLARRTYDESGNYTVQAFRGTTRESQRRRTLTVPAFTVGTSFTKGEYVSAGTGSSSSSSGGASGIGIVVDWNPTDNALVVDLVTSSEFVAGDYVINDDGDTGGFVTAVSTEHFDVVLDPGKAYIFGSEFETLAPENVSLKKSREFNTAAVETTECSYGSYFIVDTIDGVFDINEHETVTLQAAASYSSSSSSGATGTIGTAVVKHVLYDTTNSYYRVYVYDVKLFTSEAFGLIERIVGQDTGAVANIDDTNGKSNGQTKLYEKSASPSIFRLPNRPVQGNLTSAQYHYRLYQTGVTISGGTAVFTIPSTSTGDLYYPFAGGNTTSNLRQNFILTGSTSGDISSAITQANRTGDTLTLSGLGAYNGETASVISVVRSTSLARTKTLVSNYEIPLDLSASGGEIDLGIADVRTLVSVIDSGSTNVTDRFVLDNGQRDNIYDYAKLRLKPDASDPGAVTVTVDYYTHSGTGPLTYNSYSGIDFADIPTYTSPNSGQLYELRDCVDFRPVREARFLGSSSSASNPDNIGFAKIIDPIDSLYRQFTSTHNFYKSRIDKIVLTKELAFDVIEGVPSDEPVEPADNPEAMTLYKVFVPPFTNSVDKVELKYVDNRRYTMRDIGKLRQRISNLEYYTSLSLLEKESSDLIVKDVNGAERFKNGLLVDPFNGHQIGNINDRGYACSMDFTEGALRPSFIGKNVSLDYDSGSSTGEELRGDQITLAPTSKVPFIEQPLASTCISVNPFNLTSWLGDMTLTPDSDTWVDTTTRPKVQVNYEGSADAWEYINNNGSSTGYGTEWNDWETTWAGESVKTSRRGGQQKVVRGHVGYSTTQEILEETTVQAIKKQTRKGIQTSYDVETVQENAGERTVNVKIVPYMRAKQITVSATMMKPNTRVYAFFGDEAVTDLCSPSTLQTDAAGDITCTFSLPGGRFTTGSKLFRLTDDVNNIAADAISTAEAVYTAKGTLTEKESLIVSTKRAIVKRTEVSENRVVTGGKTTSVAAIGNRTSQYGPGVAKIDPGPSLSARSSGVRKAAGWNDPIAQSFLVDPNNYPNGVFLSSVDLFFRDKDENLPITIDLRPSVNGYPSSSKLIPFSVVTKKSADVNTTDNPDPSDSNSYTRFEFPSYVYLAPGEYHVVARSNSDKYCAYIAEIGQRMIGSNNRITEQPYAGSFFKSQNASTWTADQAVDLTFRLNRCTFSTTTPGVVYFESEAQSPDVFYDVCHVTTNNIAFAAAPIEYEYATTPVGSSLGSYSAIRPNQNIFQLNQQELIGLGDMTVKSTLTTNDPAISPILDNTRYSVMAIENTINNNTTGETDALADLTNGASARYISRRVTLDDDFEATDLKVYLTADIPQEAEVDVYARILAAEDDTPFEERPWTQLTVSTGTLQKSRSADNTDFREYEFLASATDSNGDTTVTYGDYDDFSTFAVKVVMRSTNTSRVPVIADMRAIAVL